jgi:predicted transcriptional regulator of viral defense system
MKHRGRPYDALIGRAAEQHGYLAVDDARELGVSPAYMRKLAATGKLEHRWRGVYRVRAIPPRAGDELYEATMWAGTGASVAGESALGLWGLADVNPRHVEVALAGGRPARRTEPNPRVRVVRERIEQEQIEEVDNIPVVTPRVAIEQALKKGTDATLVRQAIKSARRRELIGETTEAKLLVALDVRERTGNVVRVP